MLTENATSETGMTGSSRVKNQSLDFLTTETLTSVGFRAVLPNGVSSCTQVTHRMFISEAVNVAGVRSFQSFTAINTVSARIQIKSLLNECFLR